MPELWYGPKLCHDKGGHRRLMTWLLGTVLLSTWYYYPGDPAIFAHQRSPVDSWALLEDSHVPQSPIERYWLATEFTSSATDLMDGLYLTGPFPAATMIYLNDVLIDEYGSFSKKRLEGLHQVMQIPILPADLQPGMNTLHLRVYDPLHASLRTPSLRRMAQSRYHLSIRAALVAVLVLTLLILGIWQYRAERRIALKLCIGLWLSSLLCLWVGTGWTATIVGALPASLSATTVSLAYSILVALLLSTAHHHGWIAWTTRQRLGLTLLWVLIAAFQLLAPRLVSLELFDRMSSLFLIFAIVMGRWERHHGLSLLYICCALLDAGLWTLQTPLTRPPVLLSVLLCFVEAATHMRRLRTVSSGFDNTKPGAKSSSPVRPMGQEATRAEL